MSFAIFTPEAFPRCLDFPPVLTATIRNNRMRYIYIYIYILYISFVPKRIGRTKWASFVYPVSVCEKHVLRVIPQVKIFLSCCRLVCRKDRFSSVSVYMCVCVYMRRLKSRGMMWSLRSKVRDISLCFDIYPNSNVPQMSLRLSATRPQNEKLQRDRAHPLPRYAISPFILSPFRRHEKIATDVP